MVVDKKTKILKFQDEHMEKETINAQGGRCGGLQGGFQRVAHNLHFAISTIMVTTMGVPSIATFEVEVV
jgi:hypothetical protein